MHKIRYFSAPDFVLARKAIDIRAGTPDPPPLQDYRLLSGLCQMPGKEFSAFATPDDDILMILRTHIQFLSSKDFVKERANRSCRNSRKRAFSPQSEQKVLPCR